MLGRIDFKTGDGSHTLILDHSALYTLESAHGLDVMSISDKLTSVVAIRTIFQVGLERARVRFQLPIDPVTENMAAAILNELNVKQSQAIVNQALAQALIGADWDEADEDDDEGDEDPKA